MAKSIYITILLLALAFSYASDQPLQTSNVARYKLVFQWPNSFCSNQTDPRHCHSSVPQVFTIHGFWGSHKEDKIVNCENGVELSNHHLQDLLRRKLNENWPTHVDGEDNFRLWRRQWWKHGRCLGLEPWEYFQTAIHLKEQIEILFDGRNLVQFFGDEGLPPNNHQTYNPQRFPTKIYTKMGSATQINCNLNSYGEVQLYEVRFCIRRGWDFLIDCPYDRYNNQYQVSNFYGYGVDSILFPDVPAPPPSPPPQTPPPPASRFRRRRRLPPPPPPGKKRSPPLPSNISPIPALPPASIPPTQPSPFRRTFAEVLTLIYSAAPPPTTSPTLPLPPASIPPPPPPFRPTYLQAARGLLHPRNTTRSSTTPPPAFGQDSRSLLGTYLQAALVSIYPCTPSCSTSDLVSTLHYVISRYLKMASRICKKVHRAFSALLCCALLRTWTHHFDRMTRKPITSSRNQGRRGRPRRRSYHWKRD